MKVKENPEFWVVVQTGYLGALALVILLTTRDSLSLDRFPLPVLAMRQEVKENPPN
ncbi:unnamed protein product, partial [Staurois parvus]